MATIQEFPFGAFVVEAAFLGDTAAFALGDGTIRLADGPAAASVAVHGGAILSAMPTRDGKRLVTAAQDLRAWDAATGAELRRDPLPATTERPATSPMTPLPGSSVMLVARGSLRRRSLASATIARAKMCAEECSTAATIATSSSSVSLTA